jgi:hypothetical protein
MPLTWEYIESNPYFRAFVFPKIEKQATAASSPARSDDSYDLYAPTGVPGILQLKYFPGGNFAV